MILLLSLLKTAINKLQLSVRTYRRILKVVWTGADLSGSKKIMAAHFDYGGTFCGSDSVSKFGSRALGGVSK